MEINRALKRIRKKENIFFIIMGILAVLIPTLAYLANLKNTFIYVYIMIIEILINSNIVKDKYMHPEI